MTAPTRPYYLANAPFSPNADLEVRDKWSGEIAARVALADRDAIDRAIAAAKGAEEAMRKLPAWARKEALEHATTLLRARQEELATMLAIEAGKPIRDARGEAQRLVDTFEIAAAEALRIDGETLTLDIAKRATGYRGMTKRVPVGACSFITPFNFPLNLVAHKVAPAIAAGCPFVLKPSEKTPLGALLLGEVLAETSLPKGAFSILPCRVEDADPFVTDERLKLLSFTGSELGWKLRARAGKKRVVLELGGNAACIVDGDQREKLDFIVDRLVFGAFYQSGQSCISVQRILAHDAIYDELRDRLVAKTKTLVAGDPKDEATFLGPMIDEAAAARLESWIRSAESRGAKILVGGTRQGAMVEATLMEGVPPDEPLQREEAFGPIALLDRFADFGDALARANDTRFGLQAGVFTGDLAHAMRAWDELEVGGVVVGDVPSFRVDNMPYGGVKSSGTGREGVRSSIREMTEERLLVLRV